MYSHDFVQRYLRDAISADAYFACHINIRIHSRVIHSPLGIIYIRPKMDVKMTTCFEIRIPYRPGDVHCFLLFHRNFQFPVIYLNELFSFKFDNKSNCHEKCFSISRLLRFRFFKIWKNGRIVFR